ncbi:MAG: branched-chain-amino-acid transaminase [Elusimicrobiota bacterium]
MKIYLNGKLVEKDKAVVSVFDHGLLYGDGVFEGIRAYNSRVFMLDEHIDRLYSSALAIMLEIPMTKKDMSNAVVATLRANKLTDGYIRLVVTRGVGDLGLDPKKCPVPTVFIITDKISLYPEEFYTKGLSIITASTRRNIPEALNPSIKSLNYLNNILAKIEAGRYGTSEAIMLNSEGNVAECTGDNIFVLKNGVLITPPPYVGVLEGITRDVVMMLASKKMKMKVQEKTFTLYQLYTADECFLTGTAAEVIPVTEVDGRKIGNGKAGKITAKLIKTFKAFAQSPGSGTPIY